MAKFAALECTLVLYCPPHDLDGYLEYLYSRLGARKFTLVREATKMYEQAVRGELGQPLDVPRKGEMVLVIEGANPPKNPLLELSVREHVTALMETGLSKPDAIKRAAKERGVVKDVVYKEML